jgi:hypothetical protein
MAGAIVCVHFSGMAKSDETEQETCDVCGSTDLWWRNCKLLCRRCHSIVKSCADL